MDVGIDFQEKGFYDMLRDIGQKYNSGYPEDKLIKLLREVGKTVDHKAKYND